LTRPKPAARSRWLRAPGAQDATKLIEQDAGEGRQPMTLIMVHAQDHLMNSLLARELSEEIIHLYQR
jgi:cellobiose-specific phosphotransferase system component IIA